jgi:hypothetical protein
LPPDDNWRPDCYTLILGPVAQLVEQRIENPRVDGSIPSQATKLKSPFQKWLGLFYFHRAVL